MIKDQLKKDLEKVLSKLRIAEEVEVTRTAREKFGDFSTNLALRLRSGQALRLVFDPEVFDRESQTESAQTRRAQGSPRAFTPRGKPSKTPIREQSSLEIAKLLTDSLKKQPYIKKLEVVAPGFVNFFIKKEVWQKEVASILKLGPKFGSNNSGKGKRARVEFVSANPTGPLHFGNGRGGPIGDTCARVLEFSGWRVIREYIDNDRGNQVLDLGRTLAARIGIIKAGEESLSYKGEYIKEVASKIKDKVGDISRLTEAQIIKKCGQLGVKILFEEIIKDAREMGIKFDYIVHESELAKKVPAVLAELDRIGLLKKKGGAVWFAPRQRRGSPGAARNQFLEDRDAVVVKSDGNFTYFTADIVYHQEKFRSGADLIVDVFGSNTIGHVPKLKALAQALGFDLEKFKVILYQFVRIKRGKEVVSMSKRAGNFVTVREVLDEVGRDATRFFLLMHDANSHIDFDLDLAKEKSAKNPVYYVQYAHARIHSILAKSKVKSQKSKVKSQLLTTNYELDLIKQISKLPEVVEEIGHSFAVQRLTFYSLELADSFHRFYENCPVLSASGDLRQARMALCRATQIALANTLNLLGVRAPDKM